MRIPGQLATGQNFGNYILDKKLGEGGLGEVWLARHARLSYKPPVAIKFVLRPRAQELERFEREVAILDRLRANRHIVKAEDYGQQDGLPYLVMEYAQGGDLNRRIKQGLTLPEIAGYLEQAADGLDFAHPLGIIHRDIKPSNLLFNAENSLLLADFGIAHEDGYDLTASEIGMGTPEYMSPEQFRDARHVEPASDIYSLGIVTFQMLTGQLPYGSRRGGKNTYDLMQGHISSPVPQLDNFNPRLPQKLQAVLEQALAKDPTARYQRVGDFVAAFRASLPVTDPTLGVEATVALASPPKATPTPTQPQPVTPLATPSIPGPVTPLASSPNGPFLTQPVPVNSVIPAEAGLTDKKRPAGLLIGALSGLGLLLIALVVGLIIVLNNKPSTTNDPTATGSVQALQPTALTTTLASSPVTTAAGVTVTVNPASFNLPLYPGARKLDVSPEIFDRGLSQFKFSGDATALVKGLVSEYYATADSTLKIKTFYKAELEKIGWKDVTDLYLGLLGMQSLSSQLNAAGGYYGIYQKGKLLVGVSLVPGSFARLLGITDVGPTESFFAVLYGNAP